MTDLRWQTLAAQAIRLVLDARARRRGRLTRVGHRERLIEGALARLERQLLKAGRKVQGRRVRGRRL